MRLNRWLMAVVIGIVSVSALVNGQSKLKPGSFLIRADSRALVGETMQLRGNVQVRIPQLRDLVITADAADMSVGAGMEPATLTFYGPVQMIVPK